jgi:glycosyltransferase involved in cell wall biosynthesis
MKIEYVTLLNDSGYANAARGYIHRLHLLGHEVSVRPTYPAINPVLLDPRLERDQAVAACIRRPPHERPELRIIHELPIASNQGLFRRDGVPTLWIYAWELATLPPTYRAVLAQAQACLTHSPFQAEVYRRELGRDSVACLPLVDPPPPARRKTARNAEAFTFLSVFRWDERKDPITLVRAYLHSFSAFEPVRLVLKVNAADPKLVLGTIRALATDSKLQGRLPEIRVVTDYLDSAQMESLYLEADVFVSPTRGEGWGLGFHEALRHGLPCIHPDSPYVVQSFFDASNSIAVPTTDVYVRGSSFAEVTPGMRWSQVSDVALGEAMRRAMEGYENLFRLPVELAPAFREEQASLDDRLQEIVVWCAALEAATG